jgi:peptide deformylase
MILEVVKYGHPALRQKGARISAVTPAIRQLAADMLETMREAHGVGLAAQQVGLALQLTVVDIRAVADRPSTLELDGRPTDPHLLMPLVLVNPHLTPFGPSETGPEGCLSFPEIYAEITRAGMVQVKAWDGEGNPIEFRCGGLLARVIQHEHDHLRGILFIDRMDKLTKQQLRPELEGLQAATKAALKRAAGQ